MDFRHTYLVAVMCLLVPVDARPTKRRAATVISLRSLFMKECNCQPGNLLQIHFDGGKPQARCNGTSLKSSTTGFTIEGIRKKKCIQYTDNQGGNPRYYALKVIKGTKVAFVNERCSSSTADASLFDEEWETPMYRSYKHTLPNSTYLYLGVNSCNDNTLSLICSDIRNRRCKFQRMSRDD